MTGRQDQGTPERMASVPLFVHEGETQRARRTARRLFILCGIILAALVISNAAWLIHIF